MTTTSRVGLELTIALPSREDAVHLDVAGDVTVAEVTEFLADHYQVERTGFRVWDGRALLSPAGRVDQTQVVRGEHVRFDVAADTAGLPLVPLINDGETYRVVLQDGAQIGLAFPVFLSGPTYLRLVDDYWVSADAARHDVAITPRQGEGVRVSTTSLSECQLSDEDATLRERDVLVGTEFAVFVPAGRFTFSCLVPGDHDEVRLANGLVRYRPTPREDELGLPEPERLSLRAHPPVDPPEMDWGAVAWQAVPLTSAVIIMSVVIGNPLVLISVVGAAGMAGYQYYRHRKAVSAHEAALDDWERVATTYAGRLRAAGEEAKASLEARHPPTPLLLWDSLQHSGRLWQRVSTSTDFLELRLGTGLWRSPWQVDYSGVRDIDNDWSEYFAAQQIVPDTPLIHDLMTEHLAVVGEPAHVADYVSTLIARLTVTHSPTDLAVLMALPPALLSHFTWVRQLPHAQIERMGWGGPTVMSGRSRIAAQLEDNAEFFASLAGSPRHVLLVAHEGSGMPVGALHSAAEAAESNLHVLWLSGSSFTVPRYVSHRVELANGGRGTVKPGGLDLQVEVAPTAGQLVRLGRSQHHLVDENEQDGRGSLPTSVALGEFVSLPLQQDADATSALVARFLAGPRGVRVLDLHEEGPHMLVAGTTGAGKSEFLRSLVLSLATDYPPSELAMLLVDYKGGASLGDLRRLPHAIGMVSNLSELDVDRLLKFLKRELERRQEILAPFSGEYVEYRRKGQNDLPRLLIVIDEFQGFVQSGDSGSGTSRQQAILNIAARGRSAGVHMVLATQHPSRDVVSAGVLANVSIKACLRTAEGDASSNIIGAPVAASIPQRLRGRLYLTTDRGSLQAVQSAHTKGVTLAGHSTTARITFADQPLFGVAAGLRDDADYLIDLMAGEL